MSEPNISFSLIIPTCDRPNLLKASISAALSVDYPNFEVIVSDNFSSQETSQVAESFCDPRLRYVRTTCRLAMPAHWDFAWSQAQGDYTIMLGDDDGLNPQILNIAQVIISQHGARILGWHGGLYYHPDWETRKKLESVPQTGNVLHLTTGHSGVVLEMNPWRLINHYCKFNIDYFPNSHNYCFQRSLGQEVLNRTGKLFWEPYPDFSSSLLMLGLLGRQQCYFWDGVGSVGGRSKVSNFHNLVDRDEENGRLHQFFDEFGEQERYPYHQPKLPTYWNGFGAAVSLAREVMPEEFAPWQISIEDFVLKTLDEFEATEQRFPFLDHPAVIQGWEEYMRSLPGDLITTVRKKRAKTRGIFSHLKNALGMKGKVESRLRESTYNDNEIDLYMKDYACASLDEVMAKFNALLNQVDHYSEHHLTHCLHQALAFKKLDLRFCPSAQGLDLLPV